MKMILARILSTFVIAVVILIIGVILSKAFSKEDDWVCKDGQWVRHGNPSAEQPTTVCKDVWYN